MLYHTATEERASHQQSPNTRPLRLEGYQIGHICTQGNSWVGQGPREICSQGLCSAAYPRGQVLQHLCIS